MANATLEDDMPKIIGNFSEEEVYKHDETSYEKIFLEMFTAVGLLSIVANSFIIFAILKYKKLRDVKNMIFLQVNILQAVYLFCAPLTVRVAIAFFSLTPVHMAVFCVSYQVENILMFAIIWFLFLLVCEWYLSIYHKEAHIKFCRIYKFLLISIYVLVVLICSVTIQHCFRYMMIVIAYLIMLISVILIVLFLFVINIIHAIKKKRVLINDMKGNIGLAVANICFLSWCPILCFLLLNLVVNVDAPVLVIFLFLLGFSSPVFNLTYLFYFDDNYSVFLKKIFTCKCNEYKNESLEDRTVNYSDMNGVQISEN